MTVRTRAQLNSDADTNLADNTTGDIGADDVRASVKNLADSAILAGDTPELASIELGHATDTTLSRGAAGFIAVEGKRVPSPASQASGDLLYRGATEWERLAKGTALQVLRQNSALTAPEWSTAREVLTATRTYFVRTDGNDTNTGLANTSGGAFLTIQKAIDTVAALDTVIHTVTIQVADGTYTGNTVLKSCVGSGDITIQGNFGTPANVIISVTNANCFQFYALGQTVYTIKDLEMRTITSGGCIFGTGQGLVKFSNVRFGVCAGAHISAYFRSQIEANGNFTTSGNAFWHYFAGFGGFIGVSGVTETYSGTPAFSGANANANNGSIIRLEASTLTGAATGKRYTVTENSVIQTGGGGTSFIPGNSAGTTATSGVYA